MWHYCPISGAMAALGICMLLVGMALGAAGLFVYTRRKGTDSTEYFGMSQKTGIANESYDTPDKSGHSDDWYCYL